MANVQEFEEIVSLNKAIENVNERRIRMSIEKELMAREAKTMKQLVEDQLAFKEQTQRNITILQSLLERQKEIGAGVSACRSTFIRGNFDQLQRLAKEQLGKQTLFHQIRQADVEKEMNKCMEDAISREPSLQFVKQQEQQLAELQKKLQNLKANKSALLKRMTNEKEIDELILQQDIVEMIREIVLYKKIELSNEKEEKLMGTSQTFNQNDIQMAEENSSEPRQSVKEKILQHSSEMFKESGEEIPNLTPLKQRQLTESSMKLNKNDIQMSEENSSVQMQPVKKKTFRNSSEMFKKSGKEIPNLKPLKQRQLTESSLKLNKNDIQMSEENSSVQMQPVKKKTFRNSSEIFKESEEKNRNVSLLKQRQMMESSQKLNKNDTPMMAKENVSEPKQSVKKALRKSSETLEKSAEEIAKFSPLKQKHVKFGFNPVNEISESIQAEAAAESSESLIFGMEIVTSTNSHLEVSSSKSEPIPKNAEAVESPSESNEDIQMSEGNISDESEQSVKKSNTSNADQVIEDDVDLISNWTSLDAEPQSKSTDAKVGAYRDDDDADSSTSLSIDLNISSRSEKHMPPPSLSFKPTSQVDPSMELETRQLLDASVNQMTEEKMTKPKEIVKKITTSNVSNILDDDFEDFQWSSPEHAAKSKTTKTKSKQADAAVDNSSFDFEFSMTDNFQNAPVFEGNDDQMDFNISDMDNELDELFK